MYRPSFREFKHQQYEGTVRAPVSKTFDATSGKFDVERPANFVMRANPDVGASLRLTAPEKDITIPAAFTRNAQESVIRGIPFSPAVKDIAMPLVQLTDSCSFQPETSAQFFESDPKQLLDLAKIMSDEKTLARTSKVQETSVLWQQADGTFTGQTEPLALYHWRFRVEPGNVCTFRSNGITSQLKLPNQITEFVYTHDRTIGVETINLNMYTDNDTYYLSTKLNEANANQGNFSLAPHALWPYLDVHKYHEQDQHTIFHTRVPVHPDDHDGAAPPVFNYPDLYIITYINVTVGEVRANIQEDGFAYFANADGQVGYYPVPLRVVSITLENFSHPAGVPFYPPTQTLTAATLPAFLAGERITIALRSLFSSTMTLDIMMPQVRFVYQDAYSLHETAPRWVLWQQYCELARNVGFRHNPRSGPLIWIVFCEIHTTRKSH